MPRNSGPSTLTGRAVSAGARLPGFLLAVLLSPHAVPAEAVDEAQIDALFSAWSPAMPGCTVGVSQDGRTLVEKAYGMADLERVAPAEPAAGELEALAGTYVSDETETTLVVRLRDGALELTRRPDTVLPLMPLYADAFESDIGTIVFRRDWAGCPASFSVVQDRVWDLRFWRLASGSAPCAVAGAGR